MSLQFSVLASGSTGNALYLETDDHAFLVDAGLSGKAMEGLMAQIDRKLDFHRLPRFFIGVNGQLIFSCQHAKPFYMVTVLMCNKDAVELIKLSINLRHQPFHRLPAKSCVN